MLYDDFAAIHADLCDKARALTKAKGHDYSGTEDTLANLKACERLGICSAETGVLVRMCDKFMRLITLTKCGEDNRAVKDESIMDTSLDLLNYTLLFEALRRERKENSAGAGADRSGDRVAESSDPAPVVQDIAPRLQAIARRYGIVAIHSRKGGGPAAALELVALSTELQAVLSELVDKEIPHDDAKDAV